MFHGQDSHAWFLSRCSLTSSSSFPHYTCGGFEVFNLIKLVGVLVSSLQSPPTGPDLFSIIHMVIYAHTLSNIVFFSLLIVFKDE